MPAFIKERALPRKIALCPHSNSISGIVSELCGLLNFAALLVITSREAGVQPGVLHLREPDHTDGAGDAASLLPASLPGTGALIPAAPLLLRLAAR